MKIAAYGCNFGNYRNELRNGLNNIIFDNNIDYYFFTDATDISSSKWNIVNIKPLKSDDVMNGFRWTSKFVKFVLPDILKKYDVVVWIDSKVLCNQKLQFTKESITQIFEADTKIVFRKHYNVNSIQQELKITIGCKIENILPGTQFLNEIKNTTFKTLHPDTCFIIRKTDADTNALFNHIFNLLKIKKLKRDQNIVSFAIDDLHYPPSNICFIENSSITKSEFVKYNPQNNNKKPFPWFKGSFFKR
jgi:hypothetical protein